VKYNLSYERREQITATAADTGRLSELIGTPFPQWAKRCHEISTGLLQTGVFGPGRIARGWCDGVPGQHSWIVIGNDCYDRKAVVVDPTLWSYKEGVTGIWIGPNRVLHTPHRAGSCFTESMPQHHGGPDIELTPAKPFSVLAKSWLDILGPLDRLGWADVAHLPVLDWPAAEIISAMYNTPQLRAVIPIDVVGMLTDRLPEYFWKGRS
jgi:hypothetical protein